jgi:hypothetical protein
MKIRKASGVILFLTSFLITSCATHDFKSVYQHKVNLRVTAELSRNAVEKELQVDLSHVRWELADKYRLKRLTYKDAYDEYKMMINHPFYARLLSDASSAASSENVLGKYKDNIKTIFINPEELEIAYSYDLKDPDVAKQIYEALFIHEFVHAADFEKFPANMNDDIYRPGQSELLSALLEGNSEYLTEKLCKEYGCEEGYEILDKGSKQKPEKNDNESTSKKKLSKLYKQELRFKYHLGKKYIAEKYKKSQGIDPMPRRLSELSNSAMLILYPENKDLVNNTFKTADQMMVGLSTLKNEFSDEEYIYHYDVYSPPRVLAAIKSLTGIKVTYPKKSPPYYQSLTLKLFNLSDENYYDFDDYSFFILLLDMGDEDKSRDFISKIAQSWKTKFTTETTTNTHDKTSNLRYVSKEKSVLIQSSNYALIVNTLKNMPDKDLLLKLSGNIFSSL